MIKDKTLRKILFGRTFSENVDWNTCKEIIMTIPSDTGVKEIRFRGDDGLLALLIKRIEALEAKRKR